MESIKWQRCLRRYEFRSTISFIREKKITWNLTKWYVQYLPLKNIYSLEVHRSPYKNNLNYDK